MVSILSRKKESPKAQKGQAQNIWGAAMFTTEKFDWKRKSFKVTQQKSIKLR